MWHVKQKAGIFLLSMSFGGLANLQKLQSLCYIDRYLTGKQGVDLAAKAQLDRPSNALRFVMYETFDLLESNTLSHKLLNKGSSKAGWISTDYVQTLCSSCFTPLLTGRRRITS